MAGFLARIPGWISGSSAGCVCRFPRVRQRGRSATGVTREMRRPIEARASPTLYPQPSRGQALVRPFDAHATQQIRINPVPRCGLGGARSPAGRRIDPLMLHHRGDALAADSGRSLGKLPFQLVIWLGAHRTVSPTLSVFSHFGAANDTSAPNASVPVSPCTFRPDSPSGRRQPRPPSAKNTTRPLSDSPGRLRLPGTVPGPGQKYRRYHPETS